jgi:hypothetical protein
MYLGENGLLHRVLGCAFDYSAVLTFNLDLGSVAHLFLACHIVQLTPEVTWLLLLTNCADLVECLLVLLILGNLLPMFKMLALELLSLLLVEYTFPLTCF